MDTKEPTRSDVIHSKGFSMSRDTNTYKEVPDNLDFSKIKVGIKSLEDAVLDLGSIKSAFPRHPYGDKNLILRAIAENDIKLITNKLAEKGKDKLKLSKIKNAT